MPKCKVHLSFYESVLDERFSYVKEEPEGIFQELLSGGQYFVHVQQDGEQLAKDQAVSSSFLNVPIYSRKHKIIFASTSVAGY